MMIILSIAAKIAFSILSSTVSTMLPISLSILPTKHISSVWTFTLFSLVLKILSLLWPINSRSTEPLLVTTICCPLLTASPKITSRSNSSNWLKKNILFCSFFFRVETMFASKSQLHLKRYWTNWATKFKIIRTQTNLKPRLKFFSLISSFKQPFCGGVLENLESNSAQRLRVKVFSLTFFSAANQGTQFVDVIPATIIKLEIKAVMQRFTWHHYGIILKLATVWNIKRKMAKNHEKQNLVSKIQIKAKS